VQKKNFELKGLKFNSRVVEIFLAEKTFKITNLGRRDDYLGLKSNPVTHCPW